MVKNHINQIVNVLQKDREEVNQITNEILEKASVVADQIDIEIAIPRLAEKKTAQKQSSFGHYQWILETSFDHSLLRFIAIISKR